MNNSQNNIQDTNQNINSKQTNDQTTMPINKAPTDKNVNTKKPITFVSFFLTLLYNHIAVFLMLFLPFTAGMLTVALIKYNDIILSPMGMSFIFIAINTGTGRLLYFLLSVTAIIFVVIGTFQDINFKYEITKKSYKKVIGFLAIILIVHIYLAGFKIPVTIDDLIMFGLFCLLFVNKFVKNKNIIREKFFISKRVTLSAFIAFVVGVLIIILYQV